MKDVTGYITKVGDVFRVDREDLETDTDLVQPGDMVEFRYKEMLFGARVTNITHGRDDETYELEML